MVATNAAEGMEGFNLQFQNQRYKDVDDRSSNSDGIVVVDPAQEDEIDAVESANAPLLSGEAARTQTRNKSSRFRLWPPSRCCVFIWALIIGLGMIFLAGLAGFFIYQNEPYMGQSEPFYPSPKGGSAKSWERCYETAKEMVGQMTLTEKVNVTTGTGWQMGMCVGNTGTVNSVRFPSICYQDGPLGIRYADNVTVFPAGLTTGATWSRDLMNQRGQAMGVESRMKGINVLMGPVMGPIGRMPAGGRNWEGFGSDPVLQGVASAETVRGIQSEGVMATAKHLIGNEQEHFRQSFEWGLPNAISTNIDDRTLHEVYLWPFADSVRAGVASVMCSYNMVNNSYACQNSKLLNGLLKDELGFQGFVVSDWLAQRSGVASALAGLDVTMPGDGLRWTDGNGLFGHQLTRAVLNGTVPMERIDDMVTRVVAAWCQVGQNYWHMPPPLGDGGPNFSSWTNDEEGLLWPGSDDKTMGRVNRFVDVQGQGDQAHKNLARKIAAEGTVLLKNEDNILPLSRNGPGNGQTSDNKYRIRVFGDDAGSGQGPNACVDRGCNQGTLAQGWGSGTVEFPYLVTPWDALQEAFDQDHVTLTCHLNNKVPDMSLEDQDLCIVFANSDGGEGYLAADGIKGDRNDLFLQKGGEELVKKVAQGCGGGKGDTIVVIHAVGPVVVENWADIPGVKAILFAHLPGQESGNAIADVLLGRVDATGRLPYTVGKSLEDYGPGGQVLYYPNGPIPQQDFDEGLYIDYRYFDQNGIEPRYPFGYGLSYTSFEYANLVVTSMHDKKEFPNSPRKGIAPPTYSNVIPDPADSLFPSGFHKLKKFIYPYLDKLTADVQSPSLPPSFYYNTKSVSSGNASPGGNEYLYENQVRVNVDITNTGDRKGSTVVQLYITFPDNVKDPVTGLEVDFPKRVLRNFRKVELVPGQEETVTMFLSRRDLSYWSVGAQQWILPTEGEFRFKIGRHVAEEVGKDGALEGRW